MGTKREDIDALIATLRDNGARNSRYRGRLKLSPEDVKKATEARELGATYEAIAHSLNVSGYTVWCAVNKRHAYEGIK